VEKTRDILRARCWSRGDTTADSIDSLMSLELSTKISPAPRPPRRRGVNIYSYYIVTLRDVAVEQAIQELCDVLAATAARVLGEVRNMPSAVAVMIGRGVVASRAVLKVCMLRARARCSTADLRLRKLRRLAARGL